MSSKKIIKKNCLAAVLLLGSLLTMSQQNNTVNVRKIGPCYLTANADGRQHVVSLTESKEGSDQIIYNYYLQLNDVADLSVVKRKVICTQPNKPIDPEQIIGKLGDVIWILTDSLIGYDVKTLDTIATETTITTKNNQALNFSDRHNSYLLDEAAQIMYISAEDGDRYKLYPDLSLKPDNSSSDSAAENYNYESSAEYKLYDRYNLKYALGCVDSSNNKLYILGSKRETAQVFSYMGTGIFPEREELRQLSIIPYKADGESVDYSIDKPVTKSETYYKAGFLLQKFYTTAWKGKKGDRIIFYYSGKTVQANCCIALTDTNGNEQWHLNTGLPNNQFTDYVVDNDCLLLWFNQPQKDAAKTILISINLSTGKLQSYRYQ